MRKKGEVNQMQNASCDIIYYDVGGRLNFKRVNACVFPMMAGITNPDPDYFINRPSPDTIYQHMFVMEYVISGKGYIEIENQKYTVQAGDFYLLNRYTTNKYYADKKDPWCKIWVNISGRLLNALTYAFQITESVLIVHDEGMEQYIRRIHEQLLTYPPSEVASSYDDIMTTLFEMFMHINHVRNKETGNRIAVSFHQITDYIYNNLLSDRLDTEFVCSYFYMSYSSLYRMCMKHVGLSPQHYILKLKTEYAKTLFSSTHCSVTRAAEVLNFSSPLYFGKVFKKYVGVSPSAWKKEDQKKERRERNPF